VRGFLGLTGYYRRFIKDFSKIARPLHKLLKDGTIFEWGEDQQESFAILRRKLTEAPLLTLPDPEKPYDVYTDACDEAIGAVLEQEGRPVAFISKALSETETRILSTYDKETTAVIYALKQWRVYLAGRKFIIHTDHWSIQHLMTQATIDKKQARWLQFLTNYDFDIVHVKGKANGAADALSRRTISLQEKETTQPLEMNKTWIPKSEYIQNEEAKIRSEETKKPQLIPKQTHQKVNTKIRSEETRRTTTEIEYESESEEEDTESEGSDQSNTEEIREENSAPIGSERSDQSNTEEICATTTYIEKEFFQKIKDNYCKDRKLKKIRKMLKEGKQYKHYYIKRGLIYNQGLDNDRLVIPRVNELQLPILKQNHDIPIVGHVGVHKTYDNIYKNFYWMGLEETVKKYIRGCETCQMNKSSKQKPSGLAKSLPIPTRPFEVVTIDFIVKLPLTADGYDTIFVVVDKLSKYCHFIPCKEAIDAEGVANLFFDNIFINHGMPSCIVSDRDRRFESEFWRTLHKLMGTELAMSTAYHPQTNGQTEERNQVLEQMLRIMVSHDQTDWKEKLTYCQFACNNMKTATGRTAFKVATGYDPITPSSLRDINTDTHVPAINDMMNERRITIQEAIEAIKQAQATQEEMYNKGRKMRTFRVGEKVWLDTKNLRWVKKMGRSTDKLAERKAGPYKITRVISDTAYTIQLPPSWKVHPTFHISLLTPYIDPNKEFPGRQKEPTPPVELAPEGDRYVVEKIVQHKPVKKGSKRKQYLVKWEGYNTSENTWVMEEDIDEEAIEEYWENKDTQRQSNIICELNMITSEGEWWNKNQEDGEEWNETFDQYINCSQVGEENMKNSSTFAKEIKEVCERRNIFEGNKQLNEEIRNTSEGNKQLNEEIRNTSEGNKQLNEEIPNTSEGNKQTNKGKAIHITQGLNSHEENFPKENKESTNQGKSSKENSKITSPQGCSQDNQILSQDEENSKTTSLQKSPKENKESTNQNKSLKKNFKTTSLQRSLQNEENSLQDKEKLQPKILQKSSQDTNQSRKEARENNT